MLVINTIKSTYQGLQQLLEEKAAYRELDKLDPYLLDDIGVRLEQGRIIYLNATAEAPKETAENRLYLAVDNLEEESENSQPPPQPVG